MSRKWEAGLVIASIVAFAAVDLAGAAMIITDVTRINSTKQAPAIAPGFVDFGDRGPADHDVGPLANTSYAFTDRTHAYVDANATTEPFPTELIGADYVLNANDDKSDGDVEIDVTFSAAVTKVYLIIDNRVTGVGDTKMAWVGTLGFTDTGMDVGIDESKNGIANQWSSVWGLDVTGPTTITFEAQAAMNGVFVRLVGYDQGQVVKHPHFSGSGIVLDRMDRHRSDPDIPEHDRRSDVNDPLREKSVLRVNPGVDDGFSLILILRRGVLAGIQAQIL